MSELLKRYEDSKTPRPEQAKQIPGLAVDYFDTTGKFAAGFNTFVKKGDPSKFTELALKYYNTERKEIVIPTNFVPTALGIDLARYTPSDPYYEPGQGDK